jgi:hypothetical protein
MRLLLFVLLAPLYTCAQGPIDGYLKGKGVLDLAPAVSIMDATQFLGSNARRYDAPYEGQMFSLFGEYGLTANFDLVATAAVVFTEARSGLQDGGFFVKYRPFHSKIGRAGTLGVMLSTGAGFPLSDYEPTATGALGQKAVFVPARLVLQWETPWGPFLNLTGGPNWRIDDLQEEDIATIRRRRPDYAPEAPPNYLSLLAKVGLPTRKFYIDAWYEYQYTKGGADYAPDVPDLPQAYGVTYAQTGGTIYYGYTPRRGIYLSGGYMLWGRNTSKITRITAGLVFKLGKKA